MNIETIYKDIYAFPTWDNDGNPNTYPIKQARGAWTKGDPLYPISATGLAPAQADAYTTSRALFLANSDVSDGVESRNYHRRGLWGSTRWSFTVGSLLWIAVDTAGSILAEAPAAASAYHCIGIAETATQFDFHPFLTYNET